MFLECYILQKNQKMFLSSLFLDNRFFSFQLRHNTFELIQLTENSQRIVEKKKVMFSESLSSKNSKSCFLNFLRFKQDNNRDFAWEVRNFSCEKSCKTSRDWVKETLANAVTFHQKMIVCVQKSKVGRVGLSYFRTWVKFEKDLRTGFCEAIQ